VKRLIIARHGQSEIGDPTVTDMTCLVTKSGCRDLARVANGLSKLNVCPDVVITSPAVRAQDSAKIFAKNLGVDPEHILVKEDIYQAERSSLFHLVHELDDSYDTVFLIGHNPGVSRLYHVLVNTDVESFGTSCAAVIDLDVESWKQVHFKNATLLSYLMPNDQEAPKGFWWRFVFWQRQKVLKIELFSAVLVGVAIILMVVYMIINQTINNERGDESSFFLERTFD